MRASTTIVALLLALAACSPGFDSPSKVTDLRVLAVSAEPSEQIYALAPPGQVEATITMLIVSPEHPVTTVNWRLTSCVPELDGGCLEGSEILMAKGQDLPGEVTVDLVFTDEMIQTALDEDDLGGFFGAALWVLGTVDQEGELTNHFLKRVLISPDWGLGRIANVNPWIDEILLGEEDEEEPLDLDDDGIWHVSVGEEHRLLPVSPEASHETHTLPTFEFEGEVDLSDPESIDFDAITFDAEDKDESLTFRFLSDLGKLSVEAKSEEINPILEDKEDKEDRDLSVTWTAPDEPGEGTIWFVVDDGFAGVGWFSVSVIVE